MDGVVFDMDGLLIDSERISLACTVRLLHQFGVDKAESVARQLIGLNDTSAREVLRHFLGGDFPVDAFREQLNQCYVSLLQEEGLPLKDGVFELLDFLEERNIPKAVATSTKTPLAQEKLDRVGILNRFSFVVGGDQVSQGKPHPEPYLKALKLLGVAPGSSLALEDSNNGARSAISAGMRVIVVPDLVEPAQDVLEKAWHVCSSLREVPLFL